MDHKCTLESEKRYPGAANLSSSYSLEQARAGKDGVMEVIRAVLRERVSRG